MKSNKSIERLLTLIVVLLIFNVVKDWGVVPRLHASSDNYSGYELPIKKDTSYVFIVGMSEGMELPVSLDEPVEIQSNWRNPIVVQYPKGTVMPVEIKGAVQVTNEVHWNDELEPLRVRVEDY